MAKPNRVATTIFVDLEMHEAIKFHFRRNKQFKFQRVGEQLFRGWFEAGMALEEFSPRVPQSDDLQLKRLLEMASRRDVDSSDPLMKSLSMQIEAVLTLIQAIDSPKA